METNKQKAIREAYGEYWEQVKNYVDDNGWINTTKFSVFTKPTHMPDDFYPNGEMCRKIRPKSLQGIENNNGWVKIESEADLPIENGFLECIIKGNQQQATHHFVIGDEKYMIQYFSYYKKINFNPPIY